VFLWNASTGDCEGRIDARSAVTAIAYVPGGAELATGDEAGRVRLWGLADGRAVGCEASPTSHPIAPRRTLQGHSKAIRSITFTDDGGRFATAGDDRTAKVWDTTSGQVLLTFRHARAVTGAAFSSDGKRLLTSVDDLGAHLWEVPLRNEIVAFARTRLTRECLTATERQKFFPGISSASLSCAPVPR
jgi:WD40 repeat protein